MPSPRESWGQLQKSCAKVHFWHRSVLCTQHGLWQRKARRRARSQSHSLAGSQTTAWGFPATRAKLILTLLAQGLFQDRKADKPLRLQKLSCHEVLPYQAHAIPGEKARMVLSWSKVHGKDLQPKSLVLNPLEEFGIRPLTELIVQQLGSIAEMFLKRSCDNSQSNSYIFIFLYQLIKMDLFWDFRCIFSNL